MNTKIFALAAVTALSFSVASAMAQNAPVAPQHQQTARQATAPAPRAPEATVQYGSGDRGATNFDTNMTDGGF